jgi:putative ABC transport system permease protein
VTAGRLVAQAGRSMARYPLRTALMMLGSLAGVAALVVAVSLGGAVQAKMVRTVQQIVGDGAVLVFGGGARTMGPPTGEGSRLTLDDLAAVAAEVPGVRDWDPQSALGGVSVRSAGAATTARVVGGSERWSRVTGRGVARGESFDASDVARSARVALVGETVARALFGDADPVGAEIQVGGVAARVIGVLEPFGSDMHGMDRDAEIVMPLSTVMRRLANVDVVTGAKLLVDDPERADEVAAGVRAVLRRRHAIGRDRPDDFMIVTALEAQRMVATVRRALALYVPLAAGVVLLVGAVVAAMLMLGAVGERVAEIGVRRAVGARPEDVHRQFVLETAATTLLGGLAGAAVGALAVLAVGTHARLGTGVSWPAVAVGLAASAATGWAAGVVPARRAARLSPADALR